MQRKGRRPIAGLISSVCNCCLATACSYHLSGEELLAAIQKAARHVNRFVQVLESGGQAPDHPVHPAIPETRYLKAYFCRAVQD